MVLASIRFGLRLTITALNASAKSPEQLSLRQQDYWLYPSARLGVSNGAVELGKIVTRDERFERHPAGHEKIDEARLKSRADCSPGSRCAQSPAPEPNGNALFSRASSVLVRRKSGLGQGRLSSPG
jgi:hypothetical protein